MTKNKEDIPADIVEKHTIVENAISKYFVFLKQLGYTYTIKKIESKILKYSIEYCFKNKAIDRKIYFGYTPIGIIRNDTLSLSIFRKIHMKLREYGDDISMSFYFEKYNPYYNRDKLEIDYYEGTFEQKVEGVIKEYAYLIQTDFKEVMEGKKWIENASLDWHQFG